MHEKDRPGERTKEQLEYVHLYANGMKVTLASVRHCAVVGALEMVRPDRHHHATDFYATPKSNPLSSTSLYFSSFYVSSDGCEYVSVVSFQHFHKFILSLFSYSFILSIFCVCSSSIFISFSFAFRFFGIGFCIISAPYIEFQLRRGHRLGVFALRSARGSSWCHNFVFGGETKKKRSRKSKCIPFPLVKKAFCIFMTGFERR